MNGPDILVLNLIYLSLIYTNLKIVRCPQHLFYYCHFCDGAMVEKS